MQNNAVSTKPLPSQVGTGRNKYFSLSLFPSISLLRVPLLVERNPKPEGKRTLGVVYVCLVCVCVCLCVCVCSLVMKQVKRWRVDLKRNMKDIWDRYYGMMDLNLLFLPLSSTSCLIAPLGCQSSAKITQEATPEGEERSDEASQAWCQAAMPPLPSFSLCFFFLLPIGNLMSTSSYQSEVAATVSGQRAKGLFRK